MLLSVWSALKMDKLIQRRREQFKEMVDRWPKRKVIPVPKIDILLFENVLMCYERDLERLTEVEDKLTFTFKRQSEIREDNIKLRYKIQLIRDAIMDVLDYKHNYLSFDEEPKHIQSMRTRLDNLEDVLKADFELVDKTDD